MKQRAKELRKSSSLPTPSPSGIKRSAEDVSPKNPTKMKAAGQSSLPLSEPKTPDQPTHPWTPVGWAQVASRKTKN